MYFSWVQFIFGKFAFGKQFYDPTLEGGPQKTKTCVCQNCNPKNLSKIYLFGDDDHIIVQKVP